MKFTGTVCDRHPEAEGLRYRFVSKNYQREVCVSCHAERLTAWRHREDRQQYIRHKRWKAQPKNTAYKALRRAHDEAEALGGSEGRAAFVAYLNSLSEDLTTEEVVPRMRKFIVEEFGKELYEAESKTLRRLYMDKSYKDRVYRLDISKKFDELNESLVSRKKSEAWVAQRQFWDRVFGDIAREHGVVVQSPQFTGSLS